MPLRDVAAMNTSLDNDYDALDVVVALFVGDPSNGGEEVTDADCPGYVRYSSPDSERSAAAAGRKRICLATYTADDEWALEPTHYQIFDAATGLVGWDNAPLDEPLEVTAAGEPEVAVTVFYDDSVPND
jgi:hypothetical protein